MTRNRIRKPLSILTAVARRYTYSRLAAA